MHRRRMAMRHANTTALVAGGMTPQQANEPHESSDPSARNQPPRFPQAATNRDHDHKPRPKPSRTSPSHRDTPPNLPRNPPRPRPRRPGSPSDGPGNPEPLTQPSHSAREASATGTILLIRVTSKLILSVFIYARASPGGSPSLCSLFRRSSQIRACVPVPVPFRRRRLPPDSTAPSTRISSARRFPKR